MIFNSITQKFIFFNIPTTLFSLLPFFLITGPALSDLTVSIISLIFLIYCFTKKNFSYFNKNYFYFFLLFWFYLLFNSLINNLNLDSVKISFFYFRYGVFVIAIATLIKVNNDFIKIFFYCIFFCFLILIIDGFYQYFYGVNIFGWERIGSRVSSFFGDELILGSYLSRIWPIFFGLSLLYLNKKSNLFIIVILTFILSEVLVFLSGERTSFFYINLSVIFIIFFSKKLFKLRLFIFLLSLSIISFISYFNSSAKERIIDQTLNQTNITSFKKSKFNNVYIFTKQHTEIYRTAYKMYLDNKLLGVGVKNFRNFCDNKNYTAGSMSCSTHPHNIFLQILVETGIIGFCFLFFVCLYFLRHLFLHLRFKLKNKQFFNDFEICILSVILIYIWPFVPTGNVFNNWLNIVLCISLPFLISGKNLQKSIN